MPSAINTPKKLPPEEKSKEAAEKKAAEDAKQAELDAKAAGSLLATPKIKVVCVWLTINPADERDFVSSK